MRSFGIRSLRGRFLLVVLIGVLIPLAIVGFWLTGSAARSGEEILAIRLDDALDEVVKDVGVRWVGLRSGMLDIAEDSAVQRALTPIPHEANRIGPPLPDAVLMPSTVIPHALDRALLAPLTLTSGAAHSSWRITAADRPESGRPGRTNGVTVNVPVHSSAGGAALGQLASTIDLESLVPVGAGGTAAIGVVLQVIDRTTGASLSPVPFDTDLLARDRFELAGERWLVRRRVLEEPAITIAAAAPLDAYTAPFEAAAKKGSLAIVVVALAALAVVSLLTHWVTRSLEELAAATHAVAGGNLDRRVSEESGTEVGQVGRAFNAMTESLRATIRQLSQKEALVAVGEFAALLAHEVRNPLTSIRIDLQRVEEKLPGDSPLRVQLGRALREVGRLDQTVSGALRIVRSGNVSSDLVDLRVPLQRAIEVATPAFDQIGATLDESELAACPLPVRGDEAALEQLFLNILLNAAQALEPEGEAGVALAVADGKAQVEIWDSGSGISPDRVAKMFDPFYSTKKDGTGLGLAVARQIVTAHGGSISVASEEGKGTTVTVRLPMAR